MKPTSVNSAEIFSFGSSWLSTTASHLTGEVGSASPRPTGPVSTTWASKPGECKTSVITCDSHPASSAGSSPWFSALPNKSSDSFSTPRTVAKSCASGAASASSVNEG
ncbi:Hypothetical protein [Corynebacterium glutamicum ATCC 13032]|uniref:Uncharacterized protein n=1 Tax=Corynebacterium glutamicum (strain ATCC 13032 / DSM 20300 / JCM 1318 / BCRC 11384 / CCUG 27702 / LMG 3730 / NBRC 12168 / NCIMB 10025 / NRRL B-2784 / 534) TaxID=196627 RepID=Q8NS19_CORGL|nr:Hypothetical protein [Corynebacterium glutamicum ATCC 13032]